ncbi:MAG TPA: four helix bundle protein [Pyrinomonadaceae bacterium]|jgi:four helix bundle protein|nr:four helix bundle protein [Pyrinomonadaceae bacterium]
MTAPGKIKSHRDLIVWQKAMGLVETVYTATTKFPKEETYALTRQIRRAVISVPANIAEGQGRRLPTEYLYFLGNSRGSLWELDTHLEISLRLNYFAADHYRELKNQLDEVARILNGLMRAVEHSSDISHPASSI